MLLVRTVHDHTSAAVFCTSSGAVVPPHVAAHIAERAGLGAWASTPPPPPQPTPTPTPSASPPTDSPETRRLLHLLLTIYTADADATCARTFLSFLIRTSPAFPDPDLSSLSPTPSAAAEPPRSTTNTINGHVHSKKLPRIYSPRTLPPSIRKRPSRRFRRDGRSARSRYTSFAPCAQPHRLVKNAHSSKYLPPGRISL